MIEFKGSHFKRDGILWAVRWYVAYPISYRQLEEMMEEHGDPDVCLIDGLVATDTALATPAGCYVYCAIDSSGALVDALFSEYCDMAAARASFRSAQAVTDVTPDGVTTDNAAAARRQWPRSAQDAPLRVSATGDVAGGGFRGPAGDGRCREWAVTGVDVPICKRSCVTR